LFPLVRIRALNIHYYKAFCRSKLALTLELWLLELLFNSV